MSDNVFTTCYKLMNQSKKIDDATLDTVKLEYGKDLYSKTFIMHEHNDGPYKEYALLSERFTHYINQTIEINQEFRFLLTMVNFKNLKFDCDTVPPKLQPTDKVDILDTTNKETIPPTEVEIINVKSEPTDYNINDDQEETG
eukprot:2768749-Ditylum_brightwellii.AAC.1